MTNREYKLLKESVRVHMLQEGFFDGIKNLFKKGKEAASSFISSFKSAPATFKKVRKLINKDVQSVIKVLPPEAEPRDYSWAELLNPLTQIVFMALGIISGSEKGFMTRVNGWRKSVLNVDRWEDFDAPAYNDIFSLIDYVDDGKLQKVLDAILDGDIGDSASPEVMKYYEIMVDLKKNLSKLQRDCSKLANKMNRASKASNKTGSSASKYFRTRDGQEIKKISI